MCNLFGVKKQSREQGRGWLEADDWLQPSLKSNHEEVDAHFRFITYAFANVCIHFSS